MISEPKIEFRKEQKYAAIVTEVRQKEIPDLLPPLIPEVSSWLEKKGIKPAGAPFFNYINMEGDLYRVEVGVPVNSAFQEDDRVKSGVFPEGHYLTAVYTGNYMNLPKAHSELQKWGKAKDIKRAGSVTEFYLTDPKVEQDPEKWQTEIVSLLSDPEEHNYKLFQKE